MTVQPQSEIERLKAQWFADPCWDIEDTEGFETHYIELKAFRIGCDLDWKKFQEALVGAKAKELKCSLELAGYMIKLENKIKEMVSFMVEIGY